MTDISLHELSGTNRFDTLSNEVSRRLLQVTSQLRAADKNIGTLQRSGASSEVDRIEGEFEEISVAIGDLEDDVKELEKTITATGEPVRRYRDEIDGDGDDGKGDAAAEKLRQKRRIVVEKLDKGVEETRRLLEQMQSSVDKIKTQPTQSVDLTAMGNGDGGYLDEHEDEEDDTTSRGVVAGKVFQIQHTPLNAEQVEAQHYEAIQREAEISRIVNSVGELNQIFHDLDTLVSGQGELLDNIENNIYSTLENTRYADRELRKADSWDRKRRRCSCVLIVVVIIVMLILLALIS